MDNINEEKQDGLGDGFHKNLKKLREQNAQNEQAHKDWHKFNGLKEPMETVPKVLNEQEIHDKAKQMTKAQAEEQKKLEQAGLAQSTQSTWTPEQQANRAKIRARKERKAEKLRKRGDTGRTMEP